MADVSRQIVAINGAEWLELDSRARAARMSMPQYLRSLCGLPAMGTITTGTVTQGRSGVRRPTHALERRTITVPLSADERGRLLAEGHQAGIASLPQYIRSRAGLQIRNTSLPNTTEREDEEDDAWQRLRKLGFDPKEFFDSKP